VKVLVTGGTGYIGSHTTVELLANGHEVIIVDNLDNSSKIVLDRIEKITGKRPDFIEGDVLDTDFIVRVLKDNRVDAVIHFAALKAVGESVADPLRYYQTNVGGTVSVCKAMLATGVNKIIFSSSATVYGDQPIPYTESTPREPQNPYGRTKFVSELVLADVAAANPDFCAVALRYFNPVGAHPSGEIGEDPNGIPNNLMPYISQVAAGQREKLSVYGNDYPTKDGTAIRDYIHVADLAEGHLAALQKIYDPGFHTFNLGAGHGESVLEVIVAFEQATGQTIPYQFADRRAGDLAEYYADAALAESQLGWRVKRTITDASADAWHWQSGNPNGYKNVV